MAYDEKTAARLRAALGKIEISADHEITERRMFGGLCLLLNGKMIAGVTERRVMIRLDDAALENALEKGQVSPMDFTGKPMPNFAFVDPAQCTDPQLRAWVAMSVRYVRLRHESSTSKPKPRRVPAAREKSRGR
jgi:TfoX/Sxy family transcriptional regulator of competence genes